MNDQNFKTLPPSKFDFHKIFENFENPRNFFMKSENFLCFVLQCTQREHVYNGNGRWAQSALIA